MFLDFQTFTARVMNNPVKIKKKKYSNYEKYLLINYQTTLL